MRYHRVHVPTVCTRTTTVYWAKGQEEGRMKRGKERKKMASVREEMPTWKKRVWNEWVALIVYTSTGRIAMPRVNVSTTRVTVVTPIGFWLSRGTLKIFLDYRILIRVWGTGVATAVTVAVAVTVVHCHLVATPRHFCCLATACSKVTSSCCHLLMPRLN